VAHDHETEIIWTFEARAAFASTFTCTRKTIIEAELCLVDEANTKADVVELRPTVVIRCGSKRCQRAVEIAVKLWITCKLSVSAILRFTVEPLFHRGAPVPASKCSKSNPQRSNSFSTGQVTSRLELVLSNPTSACRVRLQSSRDSDQSSWENTSIVGGLIRVDDVVYGLTTGHLVVSSREDWDYDTGSGTGPDTASETLSRSKRPTFHSLE
jgi:hypothetical protein